MISLGKTVPAYSYDTFNARTSIRLNVPGSIEGTLWGKKLHHFILAITLPKHFTVELENVAIANALQLEAVRRHAVPIRFNTSPSASFKSLSLSVAVLERFYCLYVTLRCDLEL